MISAARPVARAFNRGPLKYVSVRMTFERRRLVAGTSWTLASTTVGLVTGALANLLLVAYLGVHGFGAWASALAFASLFGLAGDLGVAAALTKIVAERQGRHEDVGTLAGSALLLALVVGLASGFLLAFLSPFIESSVDAQGFALLLQIQALQMPSNLGISSILSLLQGQRRFRALAFFSMFQFAGDLVLSFLVLMSGGGLVGVMVAFLAASILVFALLLIRQRKDLHLGGLSELKRDLKRLVPFGIQMALTNALSTVLYQVDVVVLSLWSLDSGVVGLYALAVFVTRALWIIPGSINITTYPVVSEYSAAKNTQRVNRYVSTALAASVAITGILSSAFIMFGRPVMTIVFGPESVPAYNLALVLLLGTAPLACFRAIASSLPAVGRPEAGLRISGFAVLTVTILCLILTPAWGATGTAVAISISFIAVSVLLGWAVSRYVLPGQRDWLRARRIGATAGLSVAATLLSVLVAVPDAASASSLILPTFAWVGIVVLLGIASGGKETWGNLLRVRATLPKVA